MEAMLKKLTITNRELMREWPRLREKLHYGEVDQLVVHENGDRYLVTRQKPEHRPGDIRPLLEKLKRDGPLISGKFIRPNWTWSNKSFKLMEKLQPKKRLKRVKLEWKFKSLPDLFEE